MDRKIERWFRAPYSAPNGVQATDDGIWVVDQVTDRAALLRVSEVDEYGVLWMAREVETGSSNTSGLAWGEGALWLAANGPGDRWRAARPADAKSGEILRVDPETGETLERFPIPGGGGTHGLEYDRYEPGTLWLTTLKDQTLTQVRIAGRSPLRTVRLPYRRAHGVVRVEDGIWVVHTADRVIVKLDAASGEELDRIEVPEPHLEPHGLSIYGTDLIYCDATSGWVVRIEGV